MSGGARTSQGGFWSVARAVAWRNVHNYFTNPAVIVPGLLFPMFFFAAFAGGLSRVDSVPGFEFQANYTAFVYGFVLLQASAFGGVFTGFSIARDFESGFSRRILLAAPRRAAMIVGYWAAALCRAAFTVAVVTAVALVAGMEVVGGGLDLLGMYTLALIANAVAALFGSGVAMRLRTMQAGPAMQVPVFLLLFLAPVWVPYDLLTGWVEVRRDLGGMVFVELRDRYGVTQLKFNPETNAAAHAAARDLRSEDCICVRGKVTARGAEQVNAKMPTGEIEVEVAEIDVLTRADTPPFEITDDVATNEDLRLKYRVLDLRRRPIQSKIIARHRIAKIVRDYFDREGFIEVETPHLTKSTPEGARDYLVPSRLQHGSFFALPQSPQLFKQLLMMAGFDRYMQIARCFRDEDLRADRQPEFTQVDVEMAFAQPESVMTHIERCLAEVWEQMLGVKIELPMVRLRYDDVMRDYGIDRPDLRFKIKIKDVSALAAKTDFNVFRQAVESGGCVRCIALPGGGEMTDSQLKALTEEVKGIGAPGLPFAKVVEEGGKRKLNKGVAKFFETDERVGELCEATGASPGDLLLFAAGSEANVCKWLAWMRCELAERRGLIPGNLWRFCWVVDFPAFGWDEESKAIFSMHHPFTSPRDEDLSLMRLGTPELPPPADLLKLRAKAYDVILNGYELGGGSIRIHRPDVQSRIFQILGISPEEAKLRFEFLMDALRFAPPPHGGLALGLDRIVMLITGTNNIRDVIAFPKNAKAVCPLTNAPSDVSAAQLRELGLTVARPAK